MQRIHAIAITAVIILVFMFWLSTETCATYGAVINSNRIFAIGDVHGDLDTLCNMLEALQITINGEWNASDSTIVFMGDYLDNRRPGMELLSHGDDDEMLLLNHLFRLQDQASLTNGKLILLFGNHEIANLESDEMIRDYFIETVKRNVGTFAHKTHIGQKMMDRMQLTYSEKEFLFMHGGISASTCVADIAKLEKPRWIQINEKYKKHFPRSLYSPWLWSRECTNDATCPSNLGDFLSVMEVSRIVVGHTLVSNGIQFRCGERVICVDTGLSRAFGDLPRVQEILLITDQSIVALSFLGGLRFLKSR